MRWGVRWSVLALLLAVGVVGGYATSSLLDQRPAASGPARPVAAASPSVPVDPPPELEPDPDTPALEGDVETRLAEVGARGFEVTVPVPVGWARTDSTATEAKWVVPDHPANTYRLRIEVTSGENTLMDAMVEERVEDLLRVEEGLTVLDRGPDAIEFTYVAADHLRHGLVRWLDLSGSGEAELEIALTGREVDVPGMRELMATIVAGART